MQVTPSVHNQLVTLAKSGDPLVFAACGFSADSQVVVAIIKVTVGDTFINLSQLLPFNLHLIGVIYLEDSAADQAASLKSSLKVQHLLKYQPKGSLYFRDGSAVQDAVSKTDVFSEHLLFGLSLPCKQLSDVVQLLEASSQTPVRIFLHDCLEEIFEVRLKDKANKLFEVNKVCEDKEKANALKAEIKSATKVGWSSCSSTTERTAGRRFRLAEWSWGRFWRKTDSNLCRSRSSTSNRSRSKRGNWSTVPATTR